jgi:hypothetical protein
MHGKVRPNGIEIEVPLTHQLLARLIGSARETVTTTLRAFEREGLLERADGVYRLLVAPSMLEANAVPYDSRDGRKLARLMDGGAGQHLRVAIARASDQDEGEKQKPSA